MKTLTRSSPILVLVVLLMGFSQPSQPESEFFAEAIKGFPRPKEGEFETPESVVKAYFEAIVANRIHETFKCVPLLEQYSGATLANRLRYVKRFDSFAKSREDRYTPFIKTLNDHYKTANLFRYYLLLNSDPKIDQLFKKGRNYDPKGESKLDAWIEELEKESSLSRMAAYKVSVSQPKELAGPYQPFLGTSIKPIHEIQVSVASEAHTLTDKVWVGKIGAHFQIISFPDHAAR